MKAFVTRNSSLKWQRKDCEVFECVGKKRSTKNHSTNLYSHNHFQVAYETITSNETYQRAWLVVIVSRRCHKPIDVGMEVYEPKAVWSETGMMDIIDALLFLSIEKVSSNKDTWTAILPRWESAGRNRGEQCRCQDFVWSDGSHLHFRLLSRDATYAVTCTLSHAENFLWSACPPLLLINEPCFPPVQTVSPIDDHSTRCYVWDIFTSVSYLNLLLP